MDQKKEIILQKDKKRGLKLPNLLNLGHLLPGHYGQAFLRLEASEPLILTLRLDQKAINNSYFMVKQLSNDCKQEMNIVIKAQKPINIIVGAYANEVPKSSTFNGELIVKQGNNRHVIKLIYYIEIPRIFCKKLMYDSENKMNFIRIIMNKAITNQTHIMLVSKEKYTLNLEPGLLQKSTIANKQVPFLMNLAKKSIEVNAQEQFIVTISISTNICFKGDFKGLKKVILRNVLTLKTNSILLWCIPVQIIVVFVKQPQIK